MGTGGKIILRSVAVHNLKNIDLDIPHRKLIVICGVSGSGKSSLALDTLYAEGQRRYIESFSPYTRQYLDQLEKPEAELIDGIPPAIAVAGSISTKSSRATVGTATETYDYLRLLYAQIGVTYCLACGREVHRDTSETVFRFLTLLPLRTRFLVLWKLTEKHSESWDEYFRNLRDEGFIRVIVGNRTVDLSREIPDEAEVESALKSETLYGVVDRLAAGMPENRIRESLEAAFARGEGKCTLLIGISADELGTLDSSDAWDTFEVDGISWGIRRYSMKLSCEYCHVDYALPEPRLFSFNSPLGACPVCEGFGNTIDLDMDLVIPDKRRTIADGAVAPWNSQAYRYELEKVLEIGPEHGLPTDIPYCELDENAKELLLNGIPGTEFGGIKSFFAWLERRKYKMPIRVFLSRWRSYRPCPACGGKRLKPLALATMIGRPSHDRISGKVFARDEKKESSTLKGFSAGNSESSRECHAHGSGCPSHGKESGIRQSAVADSFEGRNIAELCEMKVCDLRVFLEGLIPQFSDWERQVGLPILRQVLSRLEFLETTGLGYLTLDRTLRSLSGGEARRVSLAAALGATLVNMLYVLDEPSIGLHPVNSLQLLKAIQTLRDRDNSVVVVEHDEAIIRAADQVIEVGQYAGERGGRIVFQGTPEEMMKSESSLTGQYLSGERGHVSTIRRKTDSGWIRLVGAGGNNLQEIDVDFPLGCLCVISGVSGSGKSTLVEKTLYPALCQRLRRDSNAKPLPYRELLGAGQIDDVILVDQSPIGRSPRSNPVTYLKAFDEIRALFADTKEAKKRNFSAGHFSFNAEEGRCPLCGGDGYIAIDMQFLADVYMRCSQCRGTRYRKEILDITYRNRNIAEVLEMTVAEAFTFFRGSRGIQNKLKHLKEVGLDYIRLGQPANTLSGGEAQRLKLASFMSTARKERCLFILDEPTTGLHFSDIVQLQDCFNALISIGHSLIVVEHNIQMMKSADHIIDLGPGAANLGGRIVAQGTPEEICACPESVTGRFLKEALESN
ncbi:MAG: excinuclease ABC subunit UvrA [Planctomycetia bacterium]|nr:excinuclease ABC subunit UvrA [Planctomycetia bacterium]